MNEALKQSAMALLRYVLLTVAASLATHGIINANMTEAFVMVGTGFAIASWGIWDKWGKAILIAQLDIWKAQAEAQAAKLRENNIAPPSPAVVADKVPNPNVTAKTVIDTVGKSLVILLAVLLITPAFAQQVAQSDANTRNATARNVPKLFQPRPEAGIGGEAGNLLERIDNMALADLEYAKAIADADSGPTSKLASTCWAAWIDRIKKRQEAAQGQMPDPHLITDVTKLIALHDSLQASSPFMVACSPLANAVKQNVTGLIGAVTGGVGGFAKLLPILP